ncbi:MAG: PVC-type heme-binding CxxCH protein [Verrucomicrobiales bacterium]
MLLTSLVSAIGVGAQAADPFAEGVRPTEPLTPEQQQKTFKLPPGFEIQLVAAEPDLRKPMNMAFDNKGRLWLTDSREYPFAAPLDKPGRDAIKIFEDFDETGRARKITTFVDGLNIPTGIYPYKNGVIAWSIPNIWYFQDTDGDGKADKREILFGPLGWERDTHGMDSSFRRGFDGWLYMTHGFNNNTVIRGKDGSELRMNSGNTYRVAVDGSRVEQHTWGQVNPFGLAFDPLGNVYSADCHSAPVYELLRGGYYPSFGKPHDGLGFAPTMIEHSHGSTAIAGIQYYSDNIWPEEFLNNTFIGNVMTSRVNRDTLSEHGSSKTAKEEPDFVATTDPWFRPVDLQFGPDGAMYIADFYNRIIGHYEVPLQHPGRDRERGRIWRVVYKGSMHPKFDVSKASAKEIVHELGSPNQTRRMIAMNEVTDRIGSAAIPVFQSELRGNAATPQQRVHMLWVLHRMNALPAEMLQDAASHPDRLVRAHVMRILSEKKQWTDVDRSMALSGLKDREGIVQRCAADALGQNPDRSHVGPLIALRNNVPAEDNHLLHTVRMAIRNQLVPAEILQGYSPNTISEAEARTVADVALGIHTSQAGAFLLDYLKKYQSDKETVGSFIRHISRYVDAERIPALAELVKSQYRSDVDQQLSLYKSLQEGAAQRGMALPPAALAWGSDLAEKLLTHAGDQSSNWRNYPAENVPPSGNPWFVQSRDSADGKNGQKFLCSLPPGGEQLTGRLRSPEFVIPKRLSFYLAGHAGFPENHPHNKNFVRLIESGTGVTLAQALPPRNDMAQEVIWNLNHHVGKKGFIELVDGDTGTAYAWLAAGRFEPAVITVPAVSPNENTKRYIAAAELTQSLGLKKLAPKLGALVQNENLEPDARAAVGRALVNLAPNENRLALAPLISDMTLSPGLRSHIAKNLASSDDTESLLVLTEAMRGSPLRVQTRLAQSLASSPTGALTLLKLVEQSQASPRVLQDKNVQDKLFAITENQVAERARAFVSAMPASNAHIQEQIDKTRLAYLANAGKAVEGGKVFTSACAACHQVDGVGSLVGPQLDGIGNRGLERLIEDILDPNRNVDHAFRTHILTLKDGDVVSGLPRREEGEVLVLADSTGKELTVPIKEIEKRRESESSLMPENFGEVLTADDLKNLLSFLMSRGNPRQ